MPAIMKVLQIEDSFKRKTIVDIIHEETKSLPEIYEVSIFKNGSEDSSELIVKTSNVQAGSRILFGREGDLDPEAFGVSLKSLIDSV